MSRFRLRPHGPVTLNEETLRDGEQTAGVIFLKDDKVAIATLLAEILPGCIINAGYPAISPAEAAAVRAVAATIRGADVECAGRATRADLDLNLDCVAEAERPRATFWFPTSTLMLNSRLHRTPSSMLAAAIDLLNYGRDRVGDRTGLGVALADVSNAEPAFIVEACGQLTEAGADAIIVCDTIGRWLPEEAAALTRAVLAAVPEAPLCIHAHNDLGLGIANTVAALQAGAPAAAVATNGLGERAGMPPTEELVAALLLRAEAIGRPIMADSTRLLELSRVVADRAGIRPSANKPIVGRSVLQRETGTQVDWMRRDRRTFQLVTPEFLGQPRYTLVIGKMSSRESLAEGLAERDIHLDDEALECVFINLKDLAGRQSRIRESDLRRLVASAPALANSQTGD